MESETVRFEDCTHPPDSVKPGPRSPLRWGSAPTEVCAMCGGHRLTDRWQTPWRPGPVDVTKDEEL